MEVARLVPFLESKILFSLTSNFEKNLKHELWLCHKNMGLSMTEIERMAIRDRKYFIREHNKQIEQEKQRLNKKRK